MVWFAEHSHEQLVARYSVLAFRCILDRSKDVESEMKRLDELLFEFRRLRFRWFGAHAER